MRKLTLIIISLILLSFSCDKEEVKKGECQVHYDCQLTDYCNLYTNVCEENPCFDNFGCGEHKNGQCVVNSTDGKAECNCFKGFELDKDNPLLCIAECDEAEGYFVNPDDNSRCVNPCENINNCGENATSCTSLGVENFECTCKDGYFFNTETNNCVNPCQEGGSCGENAIGCTSISLEEFECICRNGYVLNHINQCISLCEYDDIICSDNGNCSINNYGEAVCTCDKGYISSGFECVSVCDGETCNDLGYCITNSNGQAECLCSEGFQKDPVNALSCVRGCINGRTCGGFGVCDETSGSMECTCAEGYTNTGYSCIQTSYWRRETNDFSQAISIDNENNVYILVNTEGHQDINLIKFNTNGTKEWEVLVSEGNNYLGKSLAIDSNNNIYILGQTHFDGGDIFLTKFNTNGIEIWRKQWGTQGIEIANYISIDKNDDLHITGSTTGNFDDFTNLGGKDIFLTKLNANGVEVWNKQLGTELDDEGKSVVIDKNYNIYITGFTFGTLTDDDNLGESDIFLMKFDNLGSTEWTKQWGGRYNDYAVAVSVDNHNNVFLTYYRSLTYLNLSKIDSTGVIEWSKEWGNYYPILEIDGYLSLSLFIDKNNNIYTTYKLIIHDKGHSEYLILSKYNTSGSLNWNKVWRVPRADMFKYYFPISVDSNENIYITGKVVGTFGETSTSGASDIFLLKYKEE